MYILSNSTSNFIDIIKNKKDTPQTMKNVFLNASAGSGKTFALCLRYIALLFSGVRANEILTLTFTKEAANEMKQRITNNLALLYKDSNRDSTEARVLIDALGREYGISKETIDENISHVYFSFLKDDNRIATIDSFCNAMLRRFSFFVGVRSDFSLQEEQGGFDSFLLAAYNDSALKNIVRFLLRELNLNVKETSFSRGKSLESLMKILSDKSVEFKSYDEFKEKMQGDYILKEAYEIAKANMLDSVPYRANELSKTIELEAENLSDYLKSITPESKLSNKNLEKIYNGLKKPLKELFSNTLIKEGKHSWISTSIKPDSTQQSYIESVCQKIRAYITIYMLVLESNRLNNLYLLIDTYKSCMMRYEERENALSFDSVTRRIFDISNNLLNHHDRFDSEYFYFRLDGYINHILFDEYQDTSILQYRIFEPLFSEILSGHGKQEHRSLFFVGDSKQSLYEFRGANKAVFEESKKGLALESLRHNYRSKRAIIDFVNDRFSSIFENYENQLYSDSGDSGIVEIQTFHIDDVEWIFLHALDSIRVLLKSGIQSRDIAILARERGILQDFIEYANQREKGIEFNLDKSGKLIEQKSILALQSAFKIDKYKKSNNNDEIQCRNFHQKRLNKLLGKSYFDDVFVSIPRFPTLSRRIKFVLEEFRLFDIDCMELLRISSENPQIKDIDTLFDSIKDLESSRLKEEAIRAMSIHGSKGLGFPYVIILDTKPQKTQGRETLLYDYNGIYLNSIRLHDIKEDSYRSASMQSLVDKREESNDMQENNALYVACTRAKNGLFIFAKSDSTTVIKLKLKDKERYGELKVERRVENTEKSNPIIISKLKSRALSQEEYLSLEDDSLALSNIYAKKKQIIGLATHTLLELELGFKSSVGYDVMQSRFGFYLNDSELDSIYGRVQKFLKEKFLGDGIFNLNNLLIKCELSFLQKNSIYRIDALLSHEGKLYILEFKSTEDIDYVLLQRHTKQLESYLRFLHSNFHDREIRGFLVYLQDEVTMREVSI